MMALTPKCINHHELAKPVLHLTMKGSGSKKPLVMQSNSLRRTQIKLRSVLHTKRKVPK